jgi:hypothetical protein
MQLAAKIFAEQRVLMYVQFCEEYSGELYFKLTNHESITADRV